MWLIVGHWWIVNNSDGFNRAYNYREKQNLWLIFENLISQTTCKLKFTQFPSLLCSSHGTRAGEHTDAMWEAWFTFACLLSHQSRQDKKETETWGAWLLSTKGNDDRKCHIKRHFFFFCLVCDRADFCAASCIVRERWEVILLNQKSVKCRWPSPDLYLHLPREPRVIYVWRII